MSERKILSASMGQPFDPSKLGIEVSPGLESRIMHWDVGSRETLFQRTVDFFNLFHPIDEQSLTPLVGFSLVDAFLADLARRSLINRYNFITPQRRTVGGLLYEPQHHLGFAVRKPSHRPHENIPSLIELVQGDTKQLVVFNPRIGANLRVRRQNVTDTIAAARELARDQYGIDDITYLLGISADLLESSWEPRKGRGSRHKGKNHTYLRTLLEQEASVMCLAFSRTGPEFRALGRDVLPYTFQGRLARYERAIEEDLSLFGSDTRAERIRSRLTDYYMDILNLHISLEEIDTRGMESESIYASELIRLQQDPVLYEEDMFTRLHSFLDFVLGELGTGEAEYYLTEFFNEMPKLERVSPTTLQKSNPRDLIFPRIYVSEVDLRCRDYTTNIAPRHELTYDKARDALTDILRLDHTLDGEFGPNYTIQKLTVEGSPGASREWHGKRRGWR